ncbi:helix-turn-helix domain-containing protein [Vibrio sp. D431a]|uniref:helix-turn-helix domain-containing protein n=1 Tax=Vibrio sp. D431a TaxID=2837388 RepID=UPI00358FA7D2
MSTLIKLSDSDGFSFPSYRHVATLTGLKRSTVIRNMNELVLNGWVIKKTVKSECGRLDLNNLYQLNLKKIEKIHT